MSLMVIKADVSHAEGIISLNRRCLNQGWSDESIINDISKHDYYAAINDGEVVGYACVWMMPPEAELQDICVSPEMRRQGIARLIMEHLIKDAENNGADTVLLEVRSSNTAAIRLYEEYGFVKNS